MPIYIYQNPDSDKFIEVFQGMNDVHEYTDGNGLKWSRVFTSPNAAIDLEVDPYSNTQFIEKTANAGSMGEMWDRSSELSHKRAERNDGVDPMKKKYFKEYSKNRDGAKHLKDPD
tara:strand:+ start:1172 stop:1516 length:345 start_codon:yes stop_codon:yes gene_type:complete